MGVFYEIEAKITGQIKPYDKGEIAIAELKYVCAKHGLDCKIIKAC